MGNDTLTITLPSYDTTTSTSYYISDIGYSSGYTAADTITLPSFSSPITSYNGSSVSTITFNDNWWFGNTIEKTPFVDGFPDWDDFEKMRKEYPALDKAYENLKTIHKLCEAEWEGKKKEDNDKL